MLLKNNSIHLKAVSWRKSVIVAGVVLLGLALISCACKPNMHARTDSDKDGVLDKSDNCPATYNPDQVDSNENGVGDVCDYICGDADGNDAVNLLDITFLINYLYKSGPAPDPIEAADADGSGSVNLLDVTYLINYLYKSGPAPEC